MPPETRDFISVYLSSLRSLYQYQYYIPETIGHKRWTDYDYSNFQSAYPFKFTFSSSYKKKSKKTLEIE